MCLVRVSTAAAARKKLYPLDPYVGEADVVVFVVRKKYCAGERNVTYDTIRSTCRLLHPRARQ